MKNRVLMLLISGLFVWSCSETNSEEKRRKAIEDIRQTELDFSAMAGSDGLSEAFASYIAVDGVIKRGKNVLTGTEGIRQYYGEPGGTDDFTLEWSPDFVDASLSGELGYTYGTFKMTKTDSLGNPKITTGVFHTVWKLQADGSWKFVWD